MGDRTWRSSLTETTASTMVEWVRDYPILYSEVSGQPEVQIETPSLCQKKLILKVTKSKVKTEN